jgi:DNA-binding transcriptional LysR family regulator
MDRLETMRVFAAVAEARGFASAARKLGLSAPAVTRAIAALERRLGARLLQRTTRVVRLTEAGSRYLADCRRILHELTMAEEEVGSHQAAPRGHLSITASRLFGHMFVSPLVLEFQRKHPQVSVRAHLEDHLLDIVDGGFDVAIRIGLLPDSSLTAVRVGFVRQIFCASPAYLEAHGMPRKPEDLEKLDAIVFAGSSARSEWVLGAGRQARTVRPRSVFSTNDGNVAIAAALAGHGVARVLSYQVGEEVRAGQLVRILASFEPPPTPVNVVYAAGREAPAKVRAFVQFIAPRLRAASWLR